jgi:hypothetical protein
MLWLGLPVAACAAAMPSHAPPGTSADRLAQDSQEVGRALSSPISLLVPRQPGFPLHTLLSNGDLVGVPQPEARLCSHPSVTILVSLGLSPSPAFITSRLHASIRQSRRHLI